MPPALENARTNRPEFFFVGTHPAIDFANTLVPPPGPGIEFLRAWPDVTDWLAQMKLSKDSRLDLPETRRSEALKTVVELRQAWRDVLASLIAGGKVSDDFLMRLNRLLAMDSFHETVHRVGKKRFQLVHSTTQLHGHKLALARLLSSSPRQTLTTSGVAPTPARACSTSTTPQKIIVGSGAV